MKPFFLVIADHDKGLFNVVGPMMSDKPWTEHVCEAQKAGRNVNCHNPNGASKEEIIARVAQHMGLRYEEGNLL